MRAQAARRVPLLARDITANGLMRQTRATHSCKLKLSTPASRLHLYKRTAGYYVRETGTRTRKVLLGDRRPRRCQSVPKRFLKWPPAWAQDCVHKGSNGKCKDLNFQYMFNFQRFYALRRVRPSCVRKSSRLSRAARHRRSTWLRCWLYGSPPNCKMCPENSYGENDAPRPRLVQKWCASGVLEASRLRFWPGTPAHRSNESCVPIVVADDRRGC